MSVRSDRPSANECGARYCIWKMLGPDCPWMEAVKRGTRSFALMVSTVMLTPDCLPQSAACCLKNGSAVGMKWFHCSSVTSAPEMLAAAVVFDAAVGCGAVVAAPAGGVVGLAAGAEVGAAAGADVGAGWVALGPQAAASNRTLPLIARVRNSRRVVILSPYLPQRCGGENTSLPKHTLAKSHAPGPAAAALAAVASA